MSLRTPTRLVLGPWLLAVGSLVLGAADAVFLGLSTGLFGAGYNSPVLQGPGGLLAFAAAGLLLDGFLLSLAYGAASLAARLLRIHGLGRIAFAASIALYLPIAFGIVTHRIHTVFGQFLGFDVLINLAGGRASDAALEAASEAPGTVLLVAGVLLAVLVGVRGLRACEPWLRRRVAWVAPTARGLTVAVAATGLLGTAAFVVAERSGSSVAYGLERKPSARLLLLVARALTDFDLDGYGLVSDPVDAAPFDRQRHPFALEVPANGIDEDGVGGDLPATFSPPQPVPPPPVIAGDRRPSFLLVFLESFRADVVGSRLGGREVSPVLNRLAREGAASSSCFAHNPLTWPSRGALFQGRTVPAPGGRTLIDDFHDLGYRVAYFSGQNDLHGGSEDLVGFDRADFFYDARSDTERKTSRTTFAVSLQVPADVVLGHVRAYLTATAADPRPLFLYVNLVDNHFPYHHDGIDHLLGIEPVRRSEIRRENAERVRETYLQAAAYVDRAVGELVELWNRETDGAPLLVTADHGQSFYENGLLGHGQAVDRAQAAVPLIVVGFGGRWPEPLGVSDLRGLILANLFAPPERARFEAEPGRRIFHYLGPLGRPALVALRDMEHVAAWRFSTQRGEDEMGAPLDDGESGMLRDAIWTWESLLRASRADRERAERESR